MNGNELISCFRAVHGSCASPLTTVEKEVVATQLVYIRCAVESMLKAWANLGRCEKAAIGLIDP
jgi:hypothetical protein